VPYCVLTKKKRYLEVQVPLEGICVDHIILVLPNMATFSMLWNLPQRYTPATQWQLSVERSPASKSNTFSLERRVRQSKAVTVPTDTSLMLQVQSACSESFHKPHSAWQAHRTSHIAHPGLIIGIELNKGSVAPEVAQ